MAISTESHLRSPHEYRLEARDLRKRAGEMLIAGDRSRLLSLATMLEKLARDLESLTTRGTL
jgi:hypothetical protein